MIKKQQFSITGSLTTVSLWTVCVSHLQLYWSYIFCFSRVYECFHQPYSNIRLQYINIFLDSQLNFETALVWQIAWLDVGLCWTCHSGCKGCHDWCFCASLDLGCIRISEQDMYIMTLKNQTNYFTELLLQLTVRNVAIFNERHRNMKIIKHK